MRRLRLRPLELIERISPVVWSTQKERTPACASCGHVRAVRTFRQPEPATPRAEPCPVRVDSRQNLKPDAGFRREKRENRVRRSGRPEIDDAGIPKPPRCADEVAVEFFVVIGRVLVVRGPIRESASAAFESPARSRPSMSRRWQSDRTSLTNRTRRSATSGSTSWSLSTGVTPIVSTPVDLVRPALALLEQGYVGARGLLRTTTPPRTDHVPNPST